jgi:plasmid stability protein
MTPLAISMKGPISSEFMSASGPAPKQLLLRVPPELHQQLAARARHEGRSMNAVAIDVLRQALAPEPASEDAFAYAWHRAAERGWLSEEQLAVPPEERRPLIDLIREAREALGPLAPETADLVVADLIASRRAGL